MRFRTGDDILLKILIVAIKYLLLNSETVKKKTSQCLMKMFDGQLVFKCEWICYDYLHYCLVSKTNA